MDNIYKIKRFRNINLNKYIMQEADSDRIKESIKLGILFCEYFSNIDHRIMVLLNSEDTHRFVTINLENSIARILEITNDYIVIKLIDSHPIFNMLKSEMESNIEIFEAYARFTYNPLDNFKLITFDIVNIGG